MTRLLGKLAVVTGASSGIGHAVAHALAREGAAVVGLARRFAAPVLARRPDAGQVVEIQLDVTDEAAVRARFAELEHAGGVDVLVCSAGVGHFAPLRTAATADLRTMMDVHVLGTFLPAREALRQMQPRRRGHVVAIGSHAALRGFAECGGYTAAKAGQLGLMRVLAEEARPYDVRVTTVMPGATDTPIWDDRPGFDRGKMMKPDDVAGFVVAIVARPAIAVEEVVVTPPAGAL
ncbi:MAG: SDR family oxidoreductase [Kofleriaceae bacterium]|nr:SDR family oxidoreductase [Kofleriaceae bacterium]MCL4225439.1 SDR family oxidoreductase [Myxococcales bacterium]